jgi:hypothetical protein
VCSGHVAAVSESEAEEGGGGATREACAEAESDMAVSSAVLAAVAGCVGGRSRARIACGIGPRVCEGKGCAAAVAGRRWAEKWAAADSASSSSPLLCAQERAAGTQTHMIESLTHMLIFAVQL